MLVTRIWGKISKDGKKRKVTSEIGENK